MTVTPLNRIKDYKNKTRKKTDKILKSVEGLNPKQLSVICNKSANTYNTFEDKVEEIFKKNKINIVATSFNLEKQAVSDLKKAVNTKNVQPNDNFYSYINDRWISEYELTESQKYIVQVDDFRIVQDKVYRELIEIIEQYIAETSNKKSKKSKCIKDAFSSFKVYNTTEQTRCLSKAYLEYTNALLEDKSNVWKKLGIGNRDEITSWGCPFVWSLNPDEKNPKIYKCYLDSPQLTLIDIDV